MEPPATVKDIASELRRSPAVYAIRYEFAHTQLHSSRVRAIMVRINGEGLGSEAIKDI